MPVDCAVFILTFKCSLYSFSCIEYLCIAPNSKGPENTILELLFLPLLIQCVTSCNGFA